MKWPKYGVRKSGRFTIISISTNGKNTTKEQTTIKKSWRFLWKCPDQAKITAYIELEDTCTDKKYRSITFTFISPMWYHLEKRETSVDTSKIRVWDVDIRLKRSSSRTCYEGEVESIRGTRNESEVCRCIFFCKRFDAKDHQVQWTIDALRVFCKDATEGCALGWNLYNRFWLHWSPVVVALIGAFINIH